MAELRPIKSKADYEIALREVENLWGAKPDSPEGDRLDVLVTLIEVYEQKHFPIQSPTAIEAIQFRMEQLGLTRKDLESVIGSRGRIAEVMPGRRSLSLAMIRKLNKELGIPAEILIANTSHKAA